ncbi:MFS transporter [Streptomyces sp. ITFR-6]|uniref:MFS transporter n=1 Tax=Streptomyces sp. ITFR-6 TaxID=3075197 RepID=UPI00288BCDF8|nr:MFS transporter [Streptomyces sp. ITFR-6]WNI28250.1 MFS transporter [Streptomyces sp. ITFR-6]
MTILSSPTGGLDPGRRRMIRRATTAGGLGTLIEYFDFGIYAFVAVYIAPQFFPGDDPLVGLLLTFGVFASSYLVRPLGGWFFGRLGDRAGRRRALVLTVVTMGSASALIGFLPSYATLGTTASVLLLLARMVQGFCAGGESAGAAAYIAESAPDGRRGFYTSAMAMGSVGGFSAAAAVCGLASSLVSPDQMASWGWRIPFLAVVPLTLLCLVYRLKIEETPEFKAIPKSEIVRSPMREVVTRHPVKVVQVFLLTVAMTGTGNVAVSYFGTYLIKNRGLGSEPVYWMIAIAIALAVLTYPMVGLLSDKLGRKRVIITGYAGFLVLAYPVLLILDKATNIVALGAAFTVFMLVHAWTIVPGYVFYAEMMPRNVRYTGTALGSNLAFIVTGFAPLVITRLIDSTHTITSLTWWFLGIMVVGLAAITFVKETALKPLQAESDREESQLRPAGDSLLG